MPASFYQTAKPSPEGGKEKRAPFCFPQTKFACCFALCRDFSHCSFKPRIWDFLVRVPLFHFSLFHRRQGYSHHHPCKGISQYKFPFSLFKFSPPPSPPPLFPLLGTTGFSKLRRSNSHIFPIEQKKIRKWIFSNRIKSAFLCDFAYEKTDKASIRKKTWIK